MIKEIYGNYNFWSWLKYHYIDSVVKQTIMLLDKTRIDYNYDKNNKDKVNKKRDKKQEEELANFNSMIGINYMTQEERATRLRNIIKQKENG